MLSPRFQESDPLESSGPNFRVPLIITEVESKSKAVPRQEVDDEAEERALSLAERAASGSHGALRALYDDYSPLVYSIAVKILEDSHEAEEATQDVFVKAWKTIGSFDRRRCTVRGWLCVMARSNCLDRLRKRRIRPDQVKSKVSLFETWHGAEPSAAHGGDERSEQLSRLMAGLRPEYRETIELSYFNGYTVKEIAEIKELPEGTVKSFLRRGLMKLREVFPAS